MKTWPNQRTYSPPFGMLVQERVYTAAEYRFGFQGQEKDDEVSGNGNSNTAEFWQYDTRLGRRWNVDPLMGKYPSSSPFACFNNNPMLFSDPLGLEGEPKGGSGTRRALNQANSIVRELENDPDAGKDWNYSITWDNKRSGYTIQGENGGGGTMNQSGEADKFFVKYTFKDRVSDIFSRSDAQVHSPEFESKATTVGQTITEFHPGVGLYNFTKGMGQKAGLWEDGSNIWGEDQSNASLALETIGVAGDFAKSGVKVLGIAGDAIEGVDNTSGWVKRSVFNSLDPAFQKKVAAAIEKGIVSPTGKQGIIRLTTTEASQTGYQYKVKILGKGGDIRIYGNPMENGHIFFDKIIGH